VELAEKVREATAYARPHRITIAVMGCRVNGPGETDDADLGLWCGAKTVNLKRGETTLGAYSYDEVLGKLKEELDRLIAERAAAGSPEPPADRPHGLLLRRVLVIQHHRENLRKCSVTPIRDHPAVEVRVVRPEASGRYPRCGSREGSSSPWASRPSGRRTARSSIPPAPAWW